MTIDITGQRFGRLVAIKRTKPSESNHSRWLCRCDCGRQKIIFSTSLKSNMSRSCGCLSRELARQRKTNLRHGEGGDNKRTPEYSAWQGMIARCKPAWPYAMYYFERGITVCTRWHKFENFLADMGRRPSPKHSLDRTNNYKGYSPKNCRWATRAEQNANRRKIRAIETFTDAEIIAECKRRNITP
jgi:hypothetical protein